MARFPLRQVDRTLLSDPPGQTLARAQTLSHHSSDPRDVYAPPTCVGARCITMQFVQFHPTTLYVGEDRFLISESMRGEGARLVDARGGECMRELHLEIGRFYGKSELSDALSGLRNGVQTALVVLLAAMEARTSAGCHYRVD